MIIVQGQYFLKVDFGGSNPDFIAEEDFEYLTLIEESGNLLPSFVLCFNSSDDAVLEQIKESQDITITLGYAPGDPQSTAIVIAPLKTQIQRLGDMRRRITITGLLSALSYLSVTGTYISRGIESSLDALRSVLNALQTISSVEDVSIVGFSLKVSDQLSLVTNIAASMDKQIWIQPSISTRRFVTELWLHMYLQNSCPILAILSDGSFVLKDLVKAFSSPQLDWNFSNVYDDSDPKNIAYDGTYDITYQNGFINSWYGYGREKLEYQIESGEEVIVNQKAAAPLLASIANQRELAPRYDNHTFLNDNVHPNYWTAYLQNVQRLVFMSATKVALTFSGKFQNIHPLQMVSFQDDQLPHKVSSDKGSRSPRLSGTFMVSKVAKTMSMKGYVVAVDLVRDGIS